ncbi:MAG: hypothetical protein QXT72_04480 [Candidatus Micrarchaeia archaeon]
MFYLQLKSNIIIYVHIEDLGIYKSLQEVIPYLSEGNKEDIKEEILKQIKILTEKTSEEA